jgi:hypothetical protein
MVLLGGEAIWFSLCVGAIANTWPHFQMSISFLAIGLPAEAAFLFGSIARDLKWRWQPTIAALFAPTLLLVAISAGISSELSVGGSFTAVAFHPWTVHDRIPSATSTIAWFLASISAARGLQVANTTETFGRVIRSVVAGSFAFFILFLEMATHHSGRLAHATHLAEPLFVCYFLVALMLLRLSRAKDIEAPTSAGAIATASAMWRLMLAAPLVIVALIAFFIAAALGSWGHPLISAIKSVGRAIAWFFTKIGHGLSYAIVHVVEGIAAVIGAIVGLFYHHKGSTTSGSRVPTTTTVAHAVKAAHVSPVATAVFLVIVAIAAIFGIRNLLKHRPPRIAPVSVYGGESRTSTFGWRHLFSQLLSGIRSLLKLLWRKLVPSRELVAGWRGTPSTVALQGVRRDYQRLLVAARKSGLGRATHETPSEFNHRLLAALNDATDADPIEQLTTDYERARYGGSEADPDDSLAMSGKNDVSAATDTVDVLIARLEALNATAPPTTDSPYVEGAVSG